MNKRLKKIIKDKKDKTPAALKIVKSTEKPILNRDLFRIMSGLGACQNFKGRNFSYMVAENARNIQNEIDKQEKAVEKDLTKEHGGQLKEYREKLSDLRNKHEIIPGVSETAEYKADEKALNKKYKDCIDGFDKSRKEMLEDKSKIKIMTVDLNQVPEEISGGLMADIFECIKK